MPLNTVRTIIHYPDVIFYFLHQPIIPENRDEARMRNGKILSEEIALLYLLGKCTFSDRRHRTGL